MKKNALKIISFFLVFAILFNGFYNVLQYRFEDEDGIEGMKQFYKLKENSVDVMCFGSSHMFVDINTAVLWDEYGIAAYNLGGTIQPLWNTYFYMKEALKTQNPKLLVVDCFSASLTEEYQEESGMIKNTFGMKFSKNKIDAIYVSAPDKHLAYLLGYPGFHSRYSVLEREDFVEGKGIAHYDCWKGQHLLTQTNEEIAGLRMENIKEITDTEEIADKQSEYLQKIIDLAKEENIPLLLINTPYFPTEREEKIYNRVAEIAKENGVPYINYNLFYDEMGLDFSSDFADGHHLNYKGTPKFTRLLAEDMKSLFEIPDHRNETDYRDYDMMSACYHQKTANQELMETEDLEAYLEGLSSENYLVVFGLSGGFAYVDNYAIIGNALAEYGIYPDAEAGNQFYVVNQKDGQVIYSSLDNMKQTDSISTATAERGQSRWDSELGSYDVLSVRCPTEDDYKNGYSSVVVEYNHQVYCPIYEGLTVFVYDSLNETMVETVGFYLENGSFCLNKWR